MAASLPMVSATGCRRRFASWPFSENKAARRKCYQDAWIAIDGSFATRKCKILDISEGDAKLKVEDSRFVRTHFQLQLKLTRAGAGRFCKVVWRAGSKLDRAGHILCRSILGGLHHQYARI
jgi:hypothetical protein